MSDPAVSKPMSPTSLANIGKRTRTTFAMGNQCGAERWRGKLTIPAHCHPLVRRLFREMNEQRTTINEVAARSGVSRHQIWGWRSRWKPKLDALDACFNVLGLRLAVVEDDRP